MENNINYVTHINYEHIKQQSKSYKKNVIKDINEAIK